MSVVSAPRRPSAAAKAENGEARTPRRARTYLEGTRGGQAAVCPVRHESLRGFAGRGPRGGDSFALRSSRPLTNHAKARQRSSNGSVSGSRKGRRAMTLRSRGSAGFTIQVSPWRRHDAFGQDGADVGRRELRAVAVPLVAHRRSGRRRPPGCAWPPACGPPAISALRPLRRLGPASGDEILANIPRWRATVRSVRQQREGTDCRGYGVRREAGRLIDPAASAMASATRDRPDTPRRSDGSSAATTGAISCVQVPERLPFCMSYSCRAI